MDLWFIRPVDNAFDAGRYITRESGRGVGLWKLSLFGPCEMASGHLASAKYLGSKKVEISRAQPLPTYPCNGFARIKSIKNGADKSILYFVFCILYSVFCFLSSAFCVMWSVLCVLCSVFCVLCSVVCVLCYVFCVLYAAVEREGWGWVGMRARAWGRWYHAPMLLYLELERSN